MEGKGWALLALLAGVVIGANHKKIAKFLAPHVKGLGASFDRIGHTMGAVGGAAAQGIGSTGHFLKGAWNQALHLVPGGQTKAAPRARAHRSMVKRRAHAMA